jgi:hypothetical protein
MTIIALIHAEELLAYAQTKAISGLVHAWKVDERSPDGDAARQQHRIRA